VKIPVIKVGTAKVKRAELHAVVTVGPETAKLLSDKLGRKVEVGEQIDLGMVAMYDSSPWTRFKENVKIAIAQTKSPFRKPLKKAN
jgi:hypothetical protein